MRHTRLLRSLGALLLIALAPVWAQQPQPQPSPASQQPLPQPPSVPVRSYIVEDYYSGRALAEMNSDERMEPASITKLMTAYIVYQRIKAGSVKSTDPVTISERAWRAEGSRMFVQVGNQVPVEDLLMGMVVQSGNDATIALAEHIAGSETAFAELMNQEAQKLGLANTHYVNATGLPHREHYTTARDIANLARAIIKEFPDQYARYSVKEFAYNNIPQQNRNRLLWQDPSVDGVKTGHTSTAGYCLAASAKRDNTRLVTVVLGAKQEKERFSATQALLNYGFSFFETHKLYEANKTLTEARIWKGKDNELALGLAEDLYVTIPKGKYQAMQASLRVNNRIEAPAARGMPFGHVTVTLDNSPVAEVPLVALQDVPQAGFFGRAVDRVKLSIYSLFD